MKAKDEHEWMFQAYCDRMDKKGIDKEVMRVVRYFVKRLRETGVDVSRVVVFGSHFKGTANAESDIDLILVSKDFQNKNIFERAGIIRKAYADTVGKYLFGIDLIMETPEDFNPDFGIVVYAA